MMTRRNVIQLATAMVALFAGERSAPVSVSSVAERRVSRRPNILFIVLAGGIDALLTTDPRTRAEVDGAIDVPYEPSSIASVGELRFGPHIRPLVPFAEDFAFINGLAVRTAGHVPGHSQLIRCKLGYHGEEPPLLDLIGAHRGGEPLPSIALGQTFLPAYSPSGFRADALIHRARDLAPEDRRLLARVLRREAAGLRRESNADRATVAAQNADDAAAFLDRLETTPPLRIERWSDDSGVQDFGALLQTAMWAFRNDITRSAIVGVEDWDTHSDNTVDQKAASSIAFPMLARALRNMKEPGPDGRSLLDDTLIVAASELGRFPMLNRLNGKDHFPEIPVFLAGGPLGEARGRVFGRTDRMLRAMPVSLRTGEAQPSGAILDLDDLGATLLRASGIEPTVYGYHGRMLEFLGVA
jgi:uncharacterized protein (DUF1501 family)